MATEKNMPLFKESMRGLITVTVWENKIQREDGSSFTARTASLNRRYKDQNGEWKSTSTLRESDIPKAILAMQRAYEKLTVYNTEATEEAETEVVE